MTCTIIHLTSIMTLWWYFCDEPNFMRYIYDAPIKTTENKTVKSLNYFQKKKIDNTIKFVILNNKELNILCLIAIKSYNEPLET